MDHEQLVDLVKVEYGRVLSGLTLVCADQSRAEDALQEALAAACQRNDRIGNVRAWVTKVALNQLRSGHRRAGAEHRAYQRWGRRPIVGSAGLHVTDEELRRAVQSLPTRRREAVVLHYLLDLSVEQIAAATSVAPGTVKTSLHRARASLRAVVVGAHVEEEVGDVG